MDTILTMDEIEMVSAAIINYERVLRALDATGKNGKLGLTDIEKKHLLTIANLKD